MIQAHKFARDWRLDPQRAAADFTECLDLHRRGEVGGLSPREFNIQDLAAQFVTEDGKPVGLEGIRRLVDPRSSSISLTEATSAVDSTAFLNVTGQLLITMILASFESEEFVASRLIPARPTRLDGEKIPGAAKLTDLGRDPLTVLEGQDFPRHGFGEDYIETPTTTKRGMIVPLTKEAIFFDRTNLLLDRASDVGETLGLNKEKRLIDLIIGDNNTKTYKRMGTSYQTYYSTNDSGAPYINHLSGNQLVDWTDIDNAENLFAEMTDPNTSEPILVGGTQLLVPWQLRSVASRIINATEILEASSPQVRGPNPLNGRGIRLEASKQLYRRLIATDTYGHSVSAANAKGYWFYGNFAKAFAYMENWPITVTRQTDSSESAFNQDIIAAFKASERGVAAVMEPRYMTRNRADATSSSSGS
jgi:hypothetical protein